MVIVCKRCSQPFDTYLRLFRHLQRKNPCACKTGNASDIISYRNEIEQSCSPFTGTSTSTSTSTTTGNSKKPEKPRPLRNFGKENMDALPESLIHDLFLDMCVTEVLQNLFFDPEYPENRNIRLKEKFNSLEFYEKNEWHRITLNHGVNKIILRVAKIFEEYYEDNKEAVEEDMTELELEEVLDELEQIKKLDKSIIEKLTNSVLELVKNPHVESDDKKYVQSKPTRYNIQQIEI